MPDIVALRVSAWIEILENYLQNLCFVYVALRVSAWIEIVRKPPYRRLRYDRRTPCECVD